MRHLAPLVLLALLVQPGLPSARAEEPAALPGWPSERVAGQRALEKALNALPSAERLRRWHDLFCAEPHPAGTAGDARLIAAMAEAFRGMGLETDVHEFFAYMPTFEKAELSVAVGQVLVHLPLREDALPGDPSIAREIPPAFNAYAASGVAAGSVVYANYGTKEDFERLDALKVSCKDKIVIARYGRNYRGFKAKFAEARGAAGLLLYTDPADSGYVRGVPYPEGGFANAASIQRGSIKTLPYPGDPLTPFVEATKDAKRLDPATLALPKIPVQPIGWTAAREILARMRGREVPKGWQGGLPLRYRLDCGEAPVHVRLKVVQPRSIQKTANVIGVVRGATHPDEMVVVGCHLDAWTFGAGDPHAGSIVLYEMARSFAALAKQGKRPARTIMFANWGAEEFGIIGSTEWCEANAQALLGHAVAYVNLDMAAMGPDFRSAAAPALKRVIEGATRDVPQARAPETTVHAAWSKRGEGTVPFGNLGGGSDHVGFYCHLGVPSCSLGGGGSRGVSYHTAYDTLAWYRQVVGEDYEPALMLARVGNVLVSRLANAPLVPYTIQRPFADARVHLEAMFGKAADKEPAAELRTRLDVVRQKAARVEAALDRAVAEGRCAGARLDDVNRQLLSLERAWLHRDGLPGRPWYRSLYAASDPHSGYAAWMLPLLRGAVESKDRARIAAAVGVYMAALDKMEAHLDALDRLSQEE
ncbi:MAG: M28 family peptidase [Planctomycetota bacterium]|nr:M28 family peptidase [Planctomycetota bacterium]